VFVNEAILAARAWGRMQALLFHPHSLPAIVGIQLSLQRYLVSAFVGLRSVAACASNETLWLSMGQIIPDLTETSVLLMTAFGSKEESMPPLAVPRAAVVSAPMCAAARVRQRSP
jgi:hypothetical protein